MPLTQNGRLKQLALVITVLGLLATIPVIGALAYEPDATDPVRNTALPCEEVSTPGLIARTNKDIFHVANVCGFVGTDMELQSRKDLSGKVHDYAFVGTMGAGFRIYDVTEPTRPDRAAGYLDSAWQNDVQVAGTSSSPRSTASPARTPPSRPASRARARAATASTSTA